MSTQTQTLDVARFPADDTPVSRASGKRVVAVLAVFGWLGGAAVTQWWPALDDWPHTRELLIVKLLLAALSLAIAVVAWRSGASAKVRTQPGRLSLGAWLNATPWLLALSLGLTTWEVVTAQLEWLPRPFFAPPQALIAVFADDLPRLASSVLHSFVLLAYGYVAGALAGFVIGVSIGWSKAVGYWLHPVLRLIGPLPATAWLPLAFFFFPSSFSASVFLTALATAFPVAVLTWSGVASVNSAYYDVARTLGARPTFLILRVAIPAALPSVFVGLFMGLGASFAVLIVAEMMGVKAGLGWYLQWAQGWAAYPNMYAALLVMALMCSGLITLLFRVRDRVLAWQKGLLKW
ncbi:ABC transporter permease subunit [Trinickia violacea]|uniref:ABC transporter permease subunit n=1 Tax=Trinickia violacea TaxID=2571746 RepID=A0A4P8J5Q1_9BURK|nr:ABC transporter permease subunit [Trinickia violacea]QCP54229.1 ABC transporter permease subunit [Trinickia violacea]